MQQNFNVRKQAVFIAVIVTLILAMVFGSTSCSRGSYSGQIESIFIGVPALEQNALLYVAGAQNLFQNNGLNVTIKDYDTGVTAINGMLKGEIDIAEAAEFPLVNAAFQNQPVRIIGTNDRFENDYLIVRTDRGINTVADLKGKRIGVIKGTILEFYLGRFLELHGLTLKDVVIINTTTTSQTTDAMIKGEIDAVVAFQPFVNSIQTQLNDKAVVWPVQNNQLVYGILISNPDWINRHSSAVERFLRSLLEAEKFLAAHPDQAEGIVQKRLNYSSAYVTSIWNKHQFSLSLDLSLLTAMQDEARWMIDNNLTAEKTVPDFEKYIYLDGLKVVKPGAVNISR